jgi:hypothetical protein
VVVLPNDPDTILAARAAASQGAEEGLDIRVVPTLSAVQGLAAVSLWAPEDHASPDHAAPSSPPHSPPGRDGLDAQVDAMAEASDSVHYAALTVAVNDAMTAVGPCRRGQWLGIVGSAITAVDDDLAPVVGAVLGALTEALGAEPAAVTVLSGQSALGASAAAFDGALARWGAGWPELEIHRLYGGQRTYRWLLGLE